MKNYDKYFEKVIGYDDIKKELYHILEVMEEKEKFDKLGVKTPKGLLMDGKPGLGKTLMANCFIKASGRKVYTIRKEKSNGDFVNHIKKSFEEAKANAPSIVFLDDMDKFSEDQKAHNNSEEYVVVQSCIDEIKDEEVFVIATTNDIHLLPSSLVRVGRFDRKIIIYAPEKNDAIKIVDYYLKKMNYIDTINAEKIVNLLNGNSCAQLETVLNEAGLYAGCDGRDKITEDDIVEACLRVLYDAPLSESTARQKHVKEIAYHEAGHAVVSEVLEPGSVNLISVRENHGKTLGITGSRPDDEYRLSIEPMINRVKVLLGGKAATDVAFGKVDVGASGDIERAIDIVARFIDEYALLGFSKCDFDYDMQKRLTKEKKELIGNELEKYYKEVKKILVDNRVLLDKVAEKLVEKITLVGDDVRALFDKKD